MPACLPFVDGAVMLRLRAAGSEIEMNAVLA